MWCGLWKLCVVDWMYLLWVGIVFFEYCVGLIELGDYVFVSGV